MQGTGCRVLLTRSFMGDTSVPMLYPAAGVGSTVTSGEDIDVPSYDAVTTVEPVCQFATLSFWMGCFGIPPTRPATPSVPTSTAWCMSDTSRFPVLL